MDIFWSGPYSWPNFEDENHLPALPKCSGVYLQTFEYQRGYLIYLAGLTRRSMPIRFREHTRKYLLGEYNVLDFEEVRKGVRQEIWHGWGWSLEKRNEFEKRKPIILEGVCKQLRGFRIFVADIDSKNRTLERLEAAIMNNLYQQHSPFCDIPDKGMRLASRRILETPIIVSNVCDAQLHGMPSSLEI